MPKKRRAVRVAIIGGGLGGIATAVKLTKRGHNDFVVFEQSPGPGGVWWDNHYPGCAVDIPSQAYSFSFMKYKWKRTHATQAELQQYAEDVIARFGLWPRFRFNTKVTSVVWDDRRQVYDVATASGEVDSFHVVVSALGFLNVPNYPSWPGLDGFNGAKFHTARWDHSVDLTGKTVAVVGTGSTAAQVVPAIAPTVEQLYVYQREPGWISPKGERDFSPIEQWFYRYFPLVERIRRARIFYQSMQRVRGFDAHSKKQQEMRAACLEFLESTVPDTALRKALTPDYPWGCKRPVVSSDFYPALTRSNVELVPHAVTRVTPTGLQDAGGGDRDVDVLIMSTGFRATDYLSTIEVIGEGGLKLHSDIWRDRAAALLGITVPGLPNFFILYGPNTNGGYSIIAQLERQAEVATRAVLKLKRKGFQTVDTDPHALDRYIRWMDKEFEGAGSAMEANCHNYYHSASGKNITQWPFAHPRYYALSRILPSIAFRYSRRTTPVMPADR